MGFQIVGYVFAIAIVVGVTLLFSYLLSLVQLSLMFIVPSLFTLLGLFLILTAYFGNHGWGSLILLIFGILAGLSAVVSWITTIIFYHTLKSKKHRSLPR